MKALVGERRAVAAAVLVFYALVYLALSWSGQVPPELRPILTGTGALYGIAFFGLVAGWFWGRWFASGIALYGLVTGLIGVFKLGPEPVLVFVLVTHAVAALFLAGEHMAAGFDGRTEWRTRFHLDDPAVQRLGKSVTRAAMSLPILLAWALMPKQGGAVMTIAPAASLILGATGLWAVIRMRTWGVLALAGASVGAVGIAATSTGETPFFAIGAALLMAAAVAPFARPIARHLGGATA